MGVYVDSAMVKAKTDRKTGTKPGFPDNADCPTI
jgi:hypothetical protein